MERTKCPLFETVANGDSNRGSLDCESGVLPLSYRAPRNVIGSVSCTISPIYIDVDRALGFRCAEFGYAWVYQFEHGRLTICEFNLHEIEDWVSAKKGQDVTKKISFTTEIMTIKLLLHVFKLTSRPELAKARWMLMLNILKWCGTVKAINLNLNKDYALIM